MSDKLDLILAKLDKMEQRLDKMDMRFDQLESELSATKEMVATTAEDVTKLKEAVETRINDFEMGQEILVQRQFEFEKDLYRLKKAEWFKFASSVF